MPPASLYVVGAVLHHSQRMVLWRGRISGPRLTHRLQSIAPKVGEHLFLERLCKMKLESLSVAEYTVVERFFAAVNEARNHVRKEPRNNRTFWYAVTNRLLGLEALWSVILSAEDEEVGRYVRRFCN